MRRRSEEPHGVFVDNVLEALREGGGEEPAGEVLTPEGVRRPWRGGWAHCLQVTGLVVLGLILFLSSSSPLLVLRPLIDAVSYWRQSNLTDSSSLRPLPMA